MRASYILGSATLLLGLSFVACSDDETTSTTGTPGTGGDTSVGGQGTGAAPGVGGGGQGGGDQGGGGVGGGEGGSGGDNGGFVPGSGDALIFGDFDTDTVYELVKFEFPGAVKSKIELDGLGGGDITAVAISPDGTKLAVAGADKPGDSHVLNVYDVKGNGSPTTLASSATSAQEFIKLAWSPDGKWIGFIAELEQNGVDTLYVVPSDGSSSHVRVSQNTSDTTLAVTNFRWARTAGPNDAWLAFVGDVRTNNITEIFTVNAADPTPEPIEIFAPGVLTTTKKIAPTFIEWDNDGRVYFKSNHLLSTLFQVYRVDADGSNLHQVPGTNLENDKGEASVNGFAISPDGTRIAFGADSPVLNVGQLFVGTLGKNDAKVVSDVHSTNSINRSISNIHRVVWSPDESMVAVAADWEVNEGDLDNAFNLFVLPTSGTPGGVRLIEDVVTSTLLISDFEFATDAERIFVHADLQINNGHEFYVVEDLTKADQKVTDLVVQSVPNANMDVDGVIAIP